MSYTIAASEVKPGMTITDESCGIKRTLTVDRVENEANWVNAYTAERGIACIRTDTQVTVEGDRPMSMHPVGTVLRVPGVGSIVKVSEAGGTQWIDAHDGSSMPDMVDRLCGVSVVYAPKSDNEVTEVPDVVQKWEDWERDNTEWRKHDWEDADGDVWKWYEGISEWRVVRFDGTTRYDSGPGLGIAAFPVTRVK